MVAQNLWSDLEIGKSDCVYKIFCSNCSVTYIGETGRHLNERLSEHKKSVEKAAAPRHTRARSARAQSEAYSSALADHVASTNHTIAWKDVSLLATHCMNRKGRWIRESICVRADESKVTNRTDGAYMLSHTWYKLLLPRLVAHKPAGYVDPSGTHLWSWHATAYAESLKFRHQFNWMWVREFLILYILHPDETLYGFTIFCIYTLRYHTYFTFLS